MQSDTIKRVGILRGGNGNNYHASLKHGGDIILQIQENLSDKYKPVDVLIDKDGVWHMGGLPIHAEDLPSKMDMAWNTAHPTFSNDLNNLFIPHVKNSVFAHTLQESKDMFREHMKNVGVSMPRSLLIPLYQEDFDGDRTRYAIRKAKEVHEKFGAPWIVKSFAPDKSMGIHLAKTFDQLVGAIEDGVNHKQSILVEEFISGKIASMHSMRGFRDNVPNAKNGIYIFPMGNSYGNFSDEEKDNLSNLVREIYTHVGANHYLKTDFVMNPRGKVYLLNMELNPDLRAESHFVQVCELAGVKPHHIIDHILQEVL